VCTSKSAREKKTAFYEINNEALKQFGRLTALTVDGRRLRPKRRTDSHLHCAVSDRIPQVHYQNHTAAEIRAASSNGSMKSKRKPIKASNPAKSLLSLINQDAIHAAAHAVICGFIGHPIASVSSGPPESTWPASVQLCAVDFAAEPFPFHDADEVSRVLKDHGIEAARKVCGSWTMLWMAGESAQNQLNPDEGWADALLELWQIENMEDAELLAIVGEKVWEPKHHPELLRDVARGIRLARILHPSKDLEAWWSGEAYEAYEQACNWDDELFGDPKVWKAVELLARTLQVSGEVPGDQIQAIIGADRVRHLKELRASKTWQDRLGLQAAPSV
jgi:hypothetical protein